MRIFDYTYNYFVNGKFIGHTEDNRFATTMAFYTSEREYVKYIEPGLQELYLEIYDECDKNKWLMHDSPENWLGAVAHFGDSYDYIQLNTMEMKIIDAVSKADYSWLGTGDTKDLIRGSFNKSLLPYETNKLMRVFFNNFLSGMVNTVAVRTLLLCVYSLLIYTIYLICITYFIVFRKRSNIHKRILCMSVVVAISIVSNVALVSALIFAQTRYTIYNMPLFSIALIIMLYQIYADVFLKRNN